MREILPASEILDWSTPQTKRLVGSLTKKPLAIDNIALEFIETVDRRSDTQCALHGKRIALELTGLRCLLVAATASLLVDG